MVEDKDKMIVTETRPMGVSAPGYDREHERRDVNIRAILWSLVGIAITVGIVCLVVFGMFQVFEKREAAFDIPPSPVADSSVAPPLPRLQAAPAIDMAVFRRFEDSLLSGYGWVDRPAGIVHIPVDSAMALIARQGMDAVRGRLGTPTADTIISSPPSPQPTELEAVGDTVDGRR